MDTKERIIGTAIQMFNQQGYGAVTIQDIALKMGVNRRNIAYHFTNKEAFLKVIGQDLWDKIDQERHKRRDFPSFENVNNEIKMYLTLQQEYAFIFSDIHVNQHPILADKFKELCTDTIRDNENAIAFAIKLGNMKEEPFPGAYYNLSLTIWIISMNWAKQQIIQHVAGVEDITKVVWSLMLPHFTESGIASFKAFFGQEYYNSLGKPFDVLSHVALF